MDERNQRKLPRKSSRDKKILLKAKRRGLRFLYEALQLTTYNMRIFENLDLVGFIKACNKFVVTLDEHRVGAAILVCLGAMVLTGVIVMAARKPKHL